MAASILTLCLASLGLMVDTAADAVTLRDGQVILGQMIEPDRRGGPMLMVVRRSWAEADLPDRYEGWRKLEAPIVRRAEAQRKARLDAWRRDRPRDVARDDRITAWLDAMASRPEGAGDESRLTVVRLNRGEVKSIDRKPVAVGRLLRLGWTIGLAEVETMPLERVKRAVEDRGFAPGLDTPVSLDGLLPVPIESDDRWMLRRAATEIAHDGGNRFLHYQGALMPEPAPGEPPQAAAVITSAVEAIKGILDEAPAVDPLAARLRDLGAKGRTGAVVTALEMAPDFASVAVRVTVWVRVGGPDRWVAASVRTGTARPGDLAANAGAGAGRRPPGQGRVRPGRIARPGRAVARDQAKGPGDGRGDPIRPGPGSRRDRPRPGTSGPVAGLTARSRGEAVTKRRERG